MTTRAWRDLVHLTWGLLLAMVGLVCAVINVDLAAVYLVFLGFGLLFAMLLWA